MVGTWAGLEYYMAPPHWRVTSPSLGNVMLTEKGGRVCGLYQDGGRRGAILKELGVMSAILAVSGLCVWGCLAIRHDIKGASVRSWIASVPMQKQRACGPIPKFSWLFMRTCGQGPPLEGQLVLTSCSTPGPPECCP